MKNEYEKELCQWCPVTDHGERKIDGVGAMYGSCPKHMCDIAESYRKDSEEAEQSVKHHD